MIWAFIWIGLIIIAIIIAAHFLMRKVDKIINKQVNKIDANAVKEYIEDAANIKERVQNSSGPEINKGLNKHFSILAVMAFIFFTGCIRTEYIILPAFPSKPNLSFEYDQKTDRQQLKNGDEKKLLEYLDLIELWKQKTTETLIKISSK